MKKYLFIFLAILVIVFIYVAYKVGNPLLTTGIVIELPHNKEIRDTKESEVFMVHVRENDYAVSYYSTKETVADLESALVKYKELVTTNSKLQIAINASRDTNYTRIVEVISAFQEAGGTNIKLLTTEQ